jgi:hypothetical protein
MANILSNEKYALYYQKIGLLYKRPEIQASLEIILSVFTVLILISAAIRPTLVNITSLQKKIDDQTVVDKKADNKIIQLLNAQKELTTYSDSLYLFDAAVPDNFTYSENAERLQFLAKKNSLTMESLSFPGYALLGNSNSGMDWGKKILKTVNDGVFPEQIDFAIKGKPQNVINFLAEVENMDRLAILNSVTMTKQVGQTQAEDTLKASGRMSFYFYSSSTK